ncbi:MAG: HD domain-containing phosphohydrolase, partial [candidate division WOR-3 bacterium]
DCNALTIYKIGKNGTSLETFANYNVKREFHKQILEGNSEFIWQLISSKKCSVLECPCSGKNSGFSKVLDEFGFQSCLGVPLVLRGVPLGSLLLLTEKKKNYIKKDIQLIEGIARQLVIAMERIQTIEKIKEMNVESVLALVQAIEMRDPCTKGHSLSVANMAKEIAEKLDMSAKELELIEFAGLLHDVGKIVVSEDILQKPGPLSNEEWLIMKKHPLYSAEIIKPVKNLSDISEWIKYHHERWDGSGYPEGLKGETIPIYSRILAICDAYSAMTEKRPYRDGFTKDKARNEIMENSGKQFDPEIVEIFLKYMGDPS